MKKLMTVFVVWYGAPPTAKHIFLHKGSGSRLSVTRSDSSTIRGTVSSVAPSSGFLVKTKRMILCIIYFLWLTDWYSDWIIYWLIDILNEILIDCFFIPVYISMICWLFFTLIDIFNDILIDWRLIVFYWLSFDWLIQIDSFSLTTY